MSEEENVILRLQEILNLDLNSTIQKFNKKYNDGYHIDEIRAVLGKQNNTALPYISINTESGLIEEKDRIIQNTVLSISLEFFLNAHIQNAWKADCRYREAIKSCIDDHAGNQDTWEWMKIVKFDGRKINLRITV